MKTKNDKKAYMVKMRRNNYQVYSWAEDYKMWHQSTQSFSYASARACVGAHNCLRKNCSLPTHEGYCHGGVR